MMSNNVCTGQLGRGWRSRSHCKATGLCVNVLGPININNFILIQSKERLFRRFPAFIGIVS